MSNTDSVERLRDGLSASLNQMAKLRAAEYIERRTQQRQERQAQSRPSRFVWSIVLLLAVIIGVSVVANVASQTKEAHRQQVYIYAVEACQKHNQATEQTWVWHFEYGCQVERGEK